MKLRKTIIKIKIQDVKERNIFWKQKLNQIWQQICYPGLKEYQIFRYKGIVETRMEWIEEYYNRLYLIWELIDLFQNYTYSTYSELISKMKEYSQFFECKLIQEYIEYFEELNINVGVKK